MIGSKQLTQVILPGPHPFERDRNSANRRCNIKIAGILLLKVSPVHLAFHSVLKFAEGISYSQQLTIIPHTSRHTTKTNPTSISTARVFTIPCYRSVCIDSSIRGLTELPALICQLFRQTSIQAGVWIQLPAWNQSLPQPQSHLRQLIERGSEMMYPVCIRSHVTW
ncbi:hypothetical protein BMS3Bbin04_00091 [bacterium BMS3Bbin04]|nr:hypothetical protein BMS3Bbin04_00091 [bacterium BMS3Bbin04]